MTGTTGRQELLTELERYSATGIDVEEVGRLVVACLLRDKREELEGSRATGDDFVEVETSLTVSLRIRPPEENVGAKLPDGDVCCVCVRALDGVVHCEGKCCQR